MQIVRVKWRDSRMYITQISPDECEGVCEIESVGFLVRDEEGLIALAGDVLDGDWRRVLVIPRENVVEMTSDE